MHAIISPFATLLRSPRWFAPLLAALAVFVLPAAAGLATETPPPLGPGWHHGEADGIPPDQAREVLGSVQTSSSAALADAAAVTPEIQAIADGLGRDPKLIFDLVRNHIEYVPTFGVMNGATATFQARRGNDWDQAALLVALLRAAGISATFVEGDVSYTAESVSNWLGIPTDVSTAASILSVGGVPNEFVQSPVGVKLTRVWVEAQIGGQTITLDPAFKRHTLFSGVSDLGALLGYNRQAFLNQALTGSVSDANSLQNVNEANIRAQLTTFSTNLISQINATQPTAHLHEIIGGATIIPVKTTDFANSLPEATAVNIVSRFDNVPANRLHTLRIQHEGIDKLFATHEIANRRLSLRYDGAGNAPILRLDNSPLMTGTATTIDARLPATVTIDHPYAEQGGTLGDQSGAINMISGGLYVVLHDFGGISQKVLADRDPALVEVTTSAAAVGVSADEAKSEGLHLIGLNYTLQDLLATELVGRLSDNRFLRHHIVGIVGQTDSFFVDIPFGFLSSTRLTPEANGVAAFRTLSALGSALEHGVIEQAPGPPTEAVSTVKFLQIANARGIKIFQTSSATFATIKPQLTNYSPATMAGIEAAINAGRTLVLPQDGAIVVNQFQGVGFIDDFRSGNNANTGMVITGGFLGGFNTNRSDIFDNLKDHNVTNDDADVYKSVVSYSGEPVEMATGAYVLERQDLRIGMGAPLGLAFDRFYSSGRSDVNGPLGAGWNHSYDSAINRLTNGPIALGLGQPIDAASIIAFTHISLDLLNEDPSLSEWMTGMISTKWALDQLINNTRDVIIGNDRRTFVRRADGAFNPPPGSSERLIEGNDGARIEDPMGHVYFFDNQGKLRSRTDRNGNSMTYAYDGSGRLTSVTGAYGEVFNFAYDGSGRLTNLTDSAGRTVGFTYDVQGRLTSVTDARGKVWRYEYDSRNRMTRVLQAADTRRGPPSPMMTNEYDIFDRVIRQTDGVGTITNFGWSDFRNAETYPDGSQLVHHYDARGRLTGLEDAAGERNHIETDGRGFVRKITDKLGGAELYEYDLNAGMLSSITDPQGHTQRYTFASSTQSIPNPLVPAQNFDIPFQQLSGIDYPDGTNERFERDGQGNLTKRTDRIGADYTYTYDARGNVTQETNPTGGVTNYAYNANGTLASRSDSDVGTTTYTDDAVRRTTRIDYPDGSNEQFEYDGNGNITGAVDGKTAVYNYSYDAAGNLTRIVNGVGMGVEQTHQFAYDVLNRLTRATDGDGGVTNFTYTYFGGIDKATLPDGTAFDLDYDNRQRMNKVNLPDGQSGLIEQNGEGIVTRIQTSGGRTFGIQSDSRGFYSGYSDAEGESFGITRNEVGRIIQARNRLGNTIDLEYDGNGNLIGLTVPALGTVRYVRNNLSALTSIRTLAGVQWTFQNSPMGRQTRVNDPLGNQWQYAYDSMGRLSVVTYPDGETETRTYDGNDNLTSRAFSGGLTLNYTYDALDRLTATNSEPVDIEYDKRNNVTETTMHGIKVEATYDAASRITRLKYGTAMDVNYTYDANGRLARVADSISGAFVDYEYDADNLVTAIGRSNGVRTLFTRDQNGRITRIAHGDLGTIDVDYDAEDNILKLIEALPDDASSILAQQAQELLFDGADQILSTGFSHDARGRRTADPRRNYGWDGADRLTTVNENGVTTTLDYTALGESASRTINGQTTDFLYTYSLPERPLIAEMQNGSMLRAYVYSPGGALLYFVDVPAARPFFYHFNQVGTTLFLSDKDGQVSDVYGYTVFGQQKSHAGPNGDQLFTYVGEHGVRREGSSGLYQMGARYYDSQTLRFLSREPLWPVLLFPQALNPYQYAFNNPARNIDPSGLFSTFLPLGFTNFDMEKVLQVLAISQNSEMGNGTSIPSVGNGGVSSPDSTAETQSASTNGSSQTDRSSQAIVKQTTLNQSGIKTQPTSSTHTNFSNLGGNVGSQNNSAVQGRNYFVNDYTSSAFPANSNLHQFSENFGNGHRIVTTVDLNQNVRQSSCACMSGCESDCSVVETEESTLAATGGRLLLILILSLLIGIRLVRRSAGRRRESGSEDAHVS